jgi:hypothetical protein
MLLNKSNMGIYEELQEIDQKIPPLPTPTPAIETERKPVSVKQRVVKHPSAERKNRTAIVPDEMNVTTQPNDDSSNQASVLARYHDSTIETLRKAVKAVGKEVSFMRLTQGEKNQLADVLYTFKRQGIKTTENEVNRIALNLLLEDYRTNGKNSVLMRVIAALLA